MKKFYVIAVAALAVGMASCNNEKKAEQASAEAAAQEQPALSPAQRNLKDGQEFLAENAKRPEVTTTETGLQYEVLREGNGPKPTAADAVEVYYEGRLIDGTVFDSSYERGETITFPLNRVIPGWTEGLQLMPVGSKYRLYIPSNLGYGPQGTPGGPIGPNAALIFDVELISIPK